MLRYQKGFNSISFSYPIVPVLAALAHGPAVVAHNRRVPEVAVHLVQGLGFRVQGLWLRVEALVLNRLNPNLHEPFGQVAVHLVHRGNSHIRNCPPPPRIASGPQA